MQTDRFIHLQAELACASAAQLLQFEQLIQQRIAQQGLAIALARRTLALSETRCCPHCQGNHVVRHGQDGNQRQRFRCLGCRRTYNILTGTAMARARKPEKWLPYLGFMTQHTSIRAIHAAGIGLNHVTLWRWRHRFLQAASSDQAALLSGVIEVETTFFPHSNKGSRGAGQAGLGKTAAASRQDRGVPAVAVLTALDSSGGVVQAKLAALSGIETVLRGRIAAGSVVCSDGCAAYARVAEQAAAEPWVVAVAASDADGITENAAAPASVVRARLGLRRVRAHHQQLRRLVDDRCRGVATRYLVLYLGWHRAMVRPGFAGAALLTRALA